MVFPVVMYRCESWTIKKTEHRKIDASELWCWRRLLRVPWTARRSNQSILRNQSWVFIGRTVVEAETLILLTPDAKSWLIWKDPDAGKDWGQEKGVTDDEMRWDEMVGCTTDSMDVSLSRFREMVKDREAWHMQSMGLQRVRHDWATEQQLH